MHLVDPLTEALRDACSDILKGDPPDAVLAETAEAHGVRIELLRRKFVESYGDPETLYARGGQAAAEARERFVSEAEFNHWFNGMMFSLGVKKSSGAGRSGP